MAYLRQGFASSRSLCLSFRMYETIGAEKEQAPNTNKRTVTMVNDIRAHFAWEI